MADVTMDIASNGSLQTAELDALVLGAGFAGHLPTALPARPPRTVREGTHDRQHELRHRRVLAGKGQVLLQECDAHTARDEVLHEAIGSCASALRIMFRELSQAV